MGNHENEELKNRFVSTMGEFNWTWALIVISKYILFCVFFFSTFVRSSERERERKRTNPTTLYVFDNFECHRMFYLTFISSAHRRKHEANRKFPKSAKSVKRWQTKRSLSHRWDFLFGFIFAEHRRNVNENENALLKLCVNIERVTRVSARNANSRMSERIEMKKKNADGE